MTEEEKIESVKHDDDCFAIREVENGTWDTPWTVGDLNKYYTDEGVMVQFRCNDPDCPGKVLVWSDDILRYLPSRPDTDLISVTERKFD